MRVRCVPSKSCQKGNGAKSRTATPLTGGDELIMFGTVIVQTLINSRISFILA